MRSLPPAHRRRLRDVWRSAGWPCRDTVEVELLAAGLLERRFDAAQRETLHLTDAGLQALAAVLARNRAAFDAHEALVARVAEAMQRDGRIVWRRLALRAPLTAVAADAGVAGGLGVAQAAAAPAGPALPSPAAAGATRWVIAMPDVYSIRHTTVEAYTEPTVHEVKVRRADLLADLKRPDKGAAYRALSSQCWYVLGPGVGHADDVPPDYGVLVDTGAGGLEVARPAPRRAVTPGFAVWMALARATAEPPPEDAAQAPLAAARPAGPAADG
ncbi:MAG: hypothetical protein KIT17_23765 [Rubrivivax sp.]|nr:hypothetical protein [Rubrivivax sp.]